MNIKNLALAGILGLAILGSGCESEKSKVQNMPTYGSTVRSSNHDIFKQSPKYIGKKIYISGYVEDVHGFGLDNDLALLVGNKRVLVNMGEAMDYWKFLDKEMTFYGVVVKFQHERSGRLNKRWGHVWIDRAFPF